jgi:CheY-like chemotaxis protein
MSVTVSTAEKIDLANTVLISLEAFGDCVKPTNFSHSKGHWHNIDYTTGNVPSLAGARLVRYTAFAARVRYASQKAKILNVALNESVLKPRSEILQGAGYEVVSALNHFDVQTACQKHSDFDLVIIGPALPKPEKRRVMQTVRQWCGRVRILELYPPGTEAVDVEADEQLPSAEEADTLLQKVAEIFAKPRKRRRGAS